VINKLQSEHTHIHTLASHKHCVKSPQLNASIDKSDLAFLGYTLLQISSVERVEMSLWSLTSFLRQEEFKDCYTLFT